MSLLLLSLLATMAEPQREVVPLTADFIPRVTFGCHGPAGSAGFYIVEVQHNAAKHLLSVSRTLNGVSTDFDFPNGAKNLFFEGDESHGNFWFMAEKIRSNEKVSVEFLVASLKAGRTSGELSLTVNGAKWSGHCDLVPNPPEVVPAQ
uniref:hypothetical protein n=1 Tax=Sphingomonas bacterium TaxID=1895847 RepID=UPI002624EB5B|nr:hypothetical protein [Sphingomonas bacterium]